MKTKKWSTSQIGRQGSGPVACLRGTIFARGARSTPGGGGGGHTGILWCGSRFMLTDSGMKTPPKKRSSSRNLRLRHRVHLRCRHRTKVYLRLGWREQAIFWRSTGPEKHLSGTAPVHIFRLGGTNSD